MQTKTIKVKGCIIYYRINNMKKSIKLFNPYAVESLKYASCIAIHRGDTSIDGDSLFWWIYN